MKARDETKVAKIGRENGVAKGECSRTDKEIRKGDIDAQFSLFPSEAAREFSNFSGIWLDWGELDQAFKEGLTTLQAERVALTTQSN